MSDSAIDYLIHRGHKVILKAKDEPDHIWFEDAMAMGATIFVSPDWDISFMCNRENLKFIRLKQGLRRVEIGKFIEKCIEKGRFD